MANSKIIAAIIIPILLISMSGYVYAHWTDTVFKQYKFHFGFFEAEIKSYKVLTEKKYNDDMITVSPKAEELEKMGGTSTLEISSVIPEAGWYIWVGLLIHNQGSTPVLIGSPTYEISDPNNVSEWFTFEEHFYGPYTGGEFATTDPPVWSGIKYYELPPEAKETVLRRLEPYKKFVLWIKLQLDPEYPGEMDFSITIAIKLAVAPAPTP
ncbi:MAG: hypothetical protein NWF14_06875 [Candidatus Bathyarchaeota archaeon]|nr:hypothetical protein [Candidatus Bathyarchaeota archaeon]